MFRSKSCFSFHRTPQSNVLGKRPCRQRQRHRRRVDLGAERKSDQRRQHTVTVQTTSIAARGARAEGLLLRMCVLCGSISGPWNNAISIITFVFVLTANTQCSFYSLENASNDFNPLTWQVNRRQALAASGHLGGEPIVKCSHSAPGRSTRITYKDLKQCWCVGPSWRSWCSGVGEQGQGRLPGSQALTGGFHMELGWGPGLGGAAFNWGHLCSGTSCSLGSGFALKGLFQSSGMYLASLARQDMVN